MAHTLLDILLLFFAIVNVVVAKILIINAIKCMSRAFHNTHKSVLAFYVNENFVLLLYEKGKDHYA